jgi:uncharacterized membrane protein YdfJ with MMPL/SSD domain
VALIPPQLAVQEANRDLLRSNYATTAGTDAQSAEALKNATALGQAFDAAKNDDSFYLPPARSVKEADRPIDPVVPCPGASIPMTRNPNRASR